MKKTFTKQLMVLMGSILTTLTVHAQVELLNNGSFENWDTIDGYSTPRSWYTLNELTQFGFEATTELTTDAHNGAYAVKLVTKQGNPSNFPGVICTGPILDSMLNPDFDHMKIPFTRKPVKLELYYKGNVVIGDTAVVTFVLTRWNIANQKSDTVADATVIMTGAQTQYKYAAAEFEYYLPLQPDSAFAIGATSVTPFGPPMGTEIYLDDIALNYNPVGLDEIRTEAVATLFPNPASDRLHVSCDYSTFDLNMYNSAGMLVIKRSCSNNEEDLDLSALPKGLYIVQLRHADRIQNSKVTIR